MKSEYTSPEMSFISLEIADIVTASSCDDGYTPCPGYECPESYGSTCTGNIYG